jgi:hypothetical protein
VPVPARVTTSELFSANDACTEVSAVMLTTQVPVPLQPPPVQPRKVAPESAVAVRVTEVEMSNLAAQVLPQSMPLGVEVTRPVPFPVGLTVSVKPFFANAASIEVSLLTTTTQVPVPLQPPPVQAVKSEAASAVAVSVTEVPGVTDKVHAVPQLIPAGVEATVPAPPPLRVTVSVTIAGGASAAGLASIIEVGASAVGAETEPHAVSEHSKRRRAIRIV